MKKADVIGVTILMVVLLILFYPVCFSHYFYSDELQQLWSYKKGAHFAMFRPQGRLLTDWLLGSLFGGIRLIDEISLIRMASIAGWLLCIPIWYTVLRRIVVSEGLPLLLPFFTTLYLVTSLPVSVSIQWASTMELFIAYTAGLLSGYLVWLQTGRYGWRLMIPAFLLAMISLFTYQNGFGCFLLPVLLCCLAGRPIDRRLTGAAAIYIAAYVVYFLLFKLYMSLSGTADITRTALATNPFSKVSYFFLKSLPAAFYFNLVVQENSKAGRLIYAVILILCMWWQVRKASGKWQYVATILVLWMLIYLPSLIVRESYSSNRTLLALDCAVFMWIFILVLQWAGYQRGRLLVPSVLSVALITIGWYNVRYIFLPPAVAEYRQLSGFIEKSYHPGIDTVYYVRTGESFVRDKYKIASSWDEFGFSSSYVPWAPEYLVRQLVYEKTGDRKLAEGVRVIDCSKDSCASRVPTPHTLIVDAPTIVGNP